jgi:hypothetical protein
MREHCRRWYFVASLLGLALLGPVAPTDAVTLDTEGAPSPPTLCPSVDVTKAAATSQTGGNRVYEFKGVCFVPPGFTPVSVTAQATTKLTGTGFQDATEKITVTGAVDGTILTKTEKCTKDPFVHGSQVCSGPRAIQMSLSAIWFQEAPLLAGRVPANQVYDPLDSGSSSPPVPPVPPGLAGQVVIVSPTEGQVFSAGSGSVLVEFKPAWPDAPPKGSVKLEWQRRSPRGGWEAHSVVSHVESYKQSHGFSIPSYFPQAGDYRLRATARQDGWTGWRVFHVADVAKATLEVKSLVLRLERHSRDPDAARVMAEVKGLQTRLGSQPGDVDAILPRLNELKREVRQIEVVPRRLTPPRRVGPATPAGKTP